MTTNKKEVHMNELEEEDAEFEEESVDEEGEEDDDEEEEDEEPKLKYQRLGSSVIEILRKDVASCMAVHGKFLALGTHWGVVYILDFNGNEIRRFSCHTATVNELSVDASGEFIASCSDDGKVFINSLYGSESTEYEYGRPVISIALDPEYAKRTSKSFAIGGRAGQLILHSKGWFGRNKESVIHSGEGPIYTIKWCRSLIAWANDQGVKIFDCDSGERITYIDRPHDSPRPDLYRCHLCWENPTTLLIGWADSIKIAIIKERAAAVQPGINANAVTASLPDQYVEISRIFQTDFFISGIAPFGEYIAVLAYIEEESTTQPKTFLTMRPEFRILTRSGDVISSDALTIHGFDQYKANDYRLGYMTEESLFYVVSPRDIVVAKPRDLDDHIAWLLERSQYEVALRAAEANEAHLREHKLVDIGEKYIEYLMSEGHYSTAAEMCTKILKRDAKLWEKWIFRFTDANQLRAICDHIPIANPVLISTVYEMVLGYFLSSNQPSDHQKFLTLVEEWPPSLYVQKNIITALKRRLRETQSVALKDALARLYTYSKKYDKTLHLYLQLKRGKAFELIENYNLFDSIRDKVRLLMEYDRDRAVQMLVSNTDRIPIDQVVEQLKNDPRLLHQYLHQLFLKDPHIGQKYHEMQVSLYAEYDYEFLGTFLRQSNYYPLDKAFKACEERHLYPEMVFILGIMGNTKEGLQLLIEKIADVKKAIEFIETQNDEELWEDLIDYSMSNPRFVSELLEHIGAYLDPIRLIKRIPEGMEIVGLRDRIVKIISDYNLQMSLREGCKEILKADCVDLAQRLYKSQRRAVKVEEGVRCATCDRNLIGDFSTQSQLVNPSSNPADGSVHLQSIQSNEIIVFYCRHVYHVSCLRPNDPNANVNPSSVSQPNANNNNLRRTTSNPAVGPEDDTLWCIICQNQTKKTKGVRNSGTGRRLGNLAASQSEMSK